ncbi:tail fiber domain-containing protein [Luteolibacter flavescens]|uniref:Tail fiber domain-containing protein n=1 Tax=Luteolibacter flavescens TaxID=1859460 RepID=A0ABT3FKS3_9BACT|nr:tail fiber domain-containing protein [Luteolibacter flavescens]MCW1884186.1 tail fiber domain-containing protein [Luteolibacter flavescens]
MRTGVATLLALLFLPHAALRAQVPNLVPQQGRVAVNGENFTGTGHFKFALVNGGGNITYWSNDGSSAGGAEPLSGITLPVTKGLYSVMLGDTTVPGMTALPLTVYANADLRLRIWFNDGTQGYQKLAPDQRLAPNGYLPDGSISAAKLARGAESPAIHVTSSFGSYPMSGNQHYVATGNTSFQLPSGGQLGDVIRIDRTGGGGITISDPGGGVWGFSSFSPPSHGIYDLYGTGNGMIYWAFARNTGSSSPSLTLHRTENRGALWNQVGFSGQHIVAFACSADGNTAISTTTPARLLNVTRNGGSSWVQRGPAEQRDWRHFACSSDGTRLYAAEDTGQLHVSADGGVTWAAIGASRPWKKLSCSADGMKLVAGLPGSPHASITVSTDGGVTWATHPTGTSAVHDVACSADGTTVIAAVDGYALVSRDGGVTWAPTTIWPGKVAISANGSTMIGLRSDSPLMISRDRGQTWLYSGPQRQWTSATCSADGSAFAAHSISGTQFWTSSGGAFHSTTQPGTVELVYGSDGWTTTRGLGTWTQSGNNLSIATGNVGIGTSAPAYPLSFGNTTGTKIALWDQPNSTADYGIGMGSSQMYFHVGAPGARFSFLDAPGGNEVLKIGTGTTAGVAINAGGNFDNPQLTLNQTTAGDWSRIRMKSDGPAWDIALSAGAAPVMNIYNGNANVLSLEHQGNATLTRNLNFLTNTGLRQMVNLWNNEHAIGVQAWTTYFRTIGGTAAGGFAWYRGGIHNDSQYNAGGGEELMRLNSGGLTVRGTFVSSSDRHMKENIREVNARDVLDKVVSMPVSRWNYLDDPDSDHIGPMAQDFHAAFRAGADDKHIATVDADGVALAAIKGLNEKLEERDREIESLRERNKAMEARLEALEKAVLKSGTGEP